MRELPDEAPFWEAGVTLVLIFNDGTFAQAHAKGDKAALLMRYREALLALAAWTGHYRTDVFRIARERCEEEVRARLAQPRLALSDREALQVALAGMRG